MLVFFKTICYVYSFQGCSDFNTYEDALRWFEYYKPFYGDVAQLDRDNDGIPCPGLPHTKNQDQYRMKVPSSSSSSQPSSFGGN